VIAEAAVKAVQQPTGRHGRAIAVRCAVGEQSSTPIGLILCDRDAFACAGCGKGRGRQHRQQRHNDKER